MNIENSKPDEDIKLDLVIEDDTGPAADGLPSGDRVTEPGVEADAHIEPTAGPEPEPETAPGPEQTVGPGPGPTDPFEEIKKQIDDLSHAFESKIKYDQHKEKIIDDLHHALQDYRQGLLKKYLQRIFMDIIKIVDDIRKFAAHHNSKADHGEVSKRLLEYLENTASDLEDLFAWEGVVPFTCEGDRVDPSRQRVVDKIETDDPEKDKKIADRLRPGYEWEGKVIRPEMVSVYVNPGSGSGNETSTEEIL